MKKRELPSTARIMTMASHGEVEILHLKQKKFGWMFSENPENRWSAKTVLAFIKDTWHMGAWA